MWNSRHWYSKFKKTLFLKVKKSLSELEKGFEELKDNEPKDRKGRINGEIEELFFKTNCVSADDIDQFEEKEMNEKGKTY